MTTPTIPICRADGIAPRNDYLWPTERWRLSEEHRRFHSRWYFGVIALADGRWAAGEDGSVFSLARNRNLNDRPCVFASRIAALRADAARTIRVMRHSTDWGVMHGGLQGKDLEFAINWILSKVASATSGRPHRPVRIAAVAGPLPDWKQRALARQALLA